MIALIDLGNTHAHLALTKKNPLPTFSSTKDLKKEALYSTLHAQRHTIDAIYLCAVGKYEFLHRLPIPIHLLNEKSDLPFAISYYTPHTLGHDRIAAAWGAKQCYPKETCLIIDVGTCITYTFLHKDYENKGLIGGAITPGIHMRLQAMGNFTEKLPTLKYNGYRRCLGQSTHTSLWAGAWYGTMMEIQGMMEAYRQTYGELKVVFCGKGGEEMEKSIKNLIFKTGKKPLYIHLCTRLTLHGLMSFFHAQATNK